MQLSRSFPGVLAPQQPLITMIRTAFLLDVASNHQMRKHGDSRSDRPTLRTNPLPEAATRPPEEVFEEVLVILGSVLVSTHVTCVQPASSRMVILRLSSREPGKVERNIRYTQVFMTCLKLVRLLIAPGDGVPAHRFGISKWHEIIPQKEANIRPPIH